uniref:BTB domain-containing protein n=1 Tax=Stomoxys calcitrans TaxID=35570 RepID=A0A1I8P749_STOCA
MANANDLLKNVSATVPEKVGDMFKVGFVIDCKFLVGKSAEAIFGHKWKFALESPVFERMFCGAFIEANNSTEVALPDDDPKIFRILRRLLYNFREADVTSLSFEDTSNLCIMADKYMVETVVKLCCGHLFTFKERKKQIKLFALARKLQDKFLLYKIELISTQLSIFGIYWRKNSSARYKQQGDFTKCHASRMGENNI